MQLLEEVQPLRPWPNQRKLHSFKRVLAISSWGEESDDVLQGQDNDTIYGGRGDDRVFLPKSFTSMGSDDNFFYYGDGTYTVRIAPDVEELGRISE